MKKVSANDDRSSLPICIGALIQFFNKNLQQFQSFVFILVQRDSLSSNVLLLSLLKLAPGAWIYIDRFVLLVIWKNRDRIDFKLTSYSVQVSFSTEYYHRLLSISSPNKAISSFFSVLFLSLIYLKGLVKSPTNFFNLIEGEVHPDDFLPTNVRATDLKHGCLISSFCPWYIWTEFNCSLFRKDLLKYGGKIFEILCKLFYTF